MNASNRRIALVTGATRGLGLETVRQLANEGLHVLLAGRDHTRAVAAALPFQAEGLSVEAIALDVTSPVSIQKAAQDVADKFGIEEVFADGGEMFRAHANHADGFGIITPNHTHFPLFEQAIEAIDGSDDPDRPRILLVEKPAAPTRPHPRAPDEPPGNVIAGPVMAVLDAGKTAIRKAATRGRSKKKAS